MLFHALLYKCDCAKFFIIHDQRPPITAVLGGFSGAQQISRDFPSEYEKNDHSIKDLLGKNVLQFGFVLAELIKSCQDAAELAEVCQVVLGVIIQ